jgi:hypothetical protein
VTPTDTACIQYTAVSRALVGRHDRRVHRFERAAINAHPIQPVIEVKKSALFQPSTQSQSVREFDF